MSENKIHNTDSDKLKIAGSLTLSPAVGVGLFLNTAIIHLALEFLSSSEKVKTRDSRTLLNVYKDAPGHVPTQMLGYLNSFYENLWDNWAKSAEQTIDNKIVIFDQTLRKFFNAPADHDINGEIKEAWRNYLENPSPSPSPSPINFQPITDNSHQSNTGVI